jgi:hypothetical protein
VYCRDNSLNRSDPNGQQDTVEAAYAENGLGALDAMPNLAAVAETMVGTRVEVCFHKYEGRRPGLAAYFGDVYHSYVITSDLTRRQKTIFRAGPTKTPSDFLNGDWGPLITTYGSYDQKKGGPKGVDADPEDKDPRVAVYEDPGDPKINLKFWDFCKQVDAKKLLYVLLQRNCNNFTTDMLKAAQIPIPALPPPVTLTSVFGWNIPLEQPSNNN